MDARTTESGAPVEKPVEVSPRPVLPAPTTPRQAVKPTFASNTMGALAEEHPEVLTAIKTSLALEMLNELRRAEEHRKRRVKEAKMRG